MRSNQLSYLAIALKASAKVDIIFIFANFFATFFNFSFNLCSEALFAYWADGVGLWVLVGSRGFFWVLLGSSGFWWVLVGSGGFWWVLVGSGGFWWVLVEIVWKDYFFCLSLLSACPFVIVFVCLSFCQMRWLLLLNKKQAHLERHACLFYRISDILLLVLDLQE